MKKKPTSSDVAKLAGVSQSAVSSILNFNNNISFSEETKARVFEAAKQLSYSLPKRKTAFKGERLVLILVPTISNQYYAEVGRSLETYAGTLGIKTIVCNTFRKRDLEKYYIELFLSMGVSGIIYTFLPSNPEFINNIDSIVPVILIGGKENDLSICSIELNDIRSAALLTKYLYRLGHRRFAYITTPIYQTTLARRLRLEGIKLNLKTLGLPETSLQVIAPGEDFMVKEDDSSMQPYEYVVGKQLTHKFISQNSGATALIGVNDMTAIGILDAVIESGNSVPEDYSVCGFDNIFIASIAKPPITTIDHQMAMRCKAALDMLIARLDPALDTTIVKADRIEYTPKLIIRESTGRAKN